MKYKVIPRKNGTQNWTSKFRFIFYRLKIAEAYDSGLTAMMTAKPSFTFVLKDSIYLIKLDNTLRTQQSISKLTHKNRKEKGLSRSILHFRHLCEMYENQIIESHKFKF